ncbi:acyl-CoA dehydrogenase family protein [Bradyrhizobium macuxiense]|nr:acyl-CoA dehydrogenase family protein [Bradyrhizobium macuxiense]
MKVQAIRTALPAPEPAITPQDLVDRAAAMRDVLRDTQDETDARGYFSEEINQRFVEAGFYRILQPKMFGGYEFDYETFFRVMVEISRGHPAAGWCLTLSASHAPVIASHWSEAAQIEIFGSSGHFAAPHRAVPGGTCLPAEGGYIISGVWPYSSGIPHSTHFFGATLLQTSFPPRVLHFLVPRGQYTVLSDWGGDRTLGMRGSGSNSVKLENVFVPEHMTAFIDKMGVGQDLRDGTPGTRLHGNPMYLGMLMGPYHAALTSPIVGAALAAIDEYRDILLSQNTFAPPITKRLFETDFQVSYGRAIALTDAAEGVLIQAMRKHMDYCRRWAETGVPASPEENFRLWGMLQSGARLACDATELLFQTAGSTASRKGSKMVRYFSDAQMYRGHMSSQYQTFAKYIARCNLGLPTGFLDL